MLLASSIFVCKSLYFSLAFLFYYHALKIGGYFFILFYYLLNFKWSSRTKKHLFVWFLSFCCCCCWRRRRRKNFCIFHLLWQHLACGYLHIFTCLLSLSLLLLVLLLLLLYFSHFIQWCFCMILRSHGFCRIVSGISLTFSTLCQWQMVFLLLLFLWFCVFYTLYFFRLCFYSSGLSPSKSVTATQFVRPDIRGDAIWSCFRF